MVVDGTNQNRLQASEITGDPDVGDQAGSVCVRDILTVCCCGCFGHLSAVMLGQFSFSALSLIALKHAKALPRREISQAVLDAAAPVPMLCRVTGWRRSARPWFWISSGGSSQTVGVQGITGRHGGPPVGLRDLVGGRMDEVHA